MSTLKITDIYPMLNLQRILGVLGPRAHEAVWSISPVCFGRSEEEWFEATGDGGDALGTLAQSRGEISGAELGELAIRTVQVIWGEFTGRLPTDTDSDWITIRAIDSTYCEIASRDETALKAITSSFRDVQIVEAV